MVLRRNRALGEPVRDEDFYRLSTPDQARFHSLVRAVVEHDALEKGGRIVAAADQDSARDHGIDFQTELGGDLDPPHLVGRGRTIFQVKFRTAATPAAFVQPAELRIRGAAARVQSAGPVDRYVLVVNLRVAGREDEIKALILADRPAGALEPQVEIVGAERLATFVNDQPMIRESHFAAGPFRALALVEEEMRTRLDRLRLPWPPLVGREPEIEAIRAWALGDSEPVLIVAGDRSAGRTRLLVEALSVPELRSRTVWRTGSDSLSTDSLRWIAHRDSRPALFVADAVPADEISSLRRAVESTAGVRGILVRNGRPADADLVVGPLDAPAAYALAASLLPGADLGEAEWVSFASEGLPGLMVPLADIVAKRGLQAMRPLESIEALRLETTRLPPGARESLRVHSLLATWEAEGRLSADVRDDLAQWLGFTPAAVRDGTADLLDAGFLVDAGGRREVAPAALGDRMAADLLRGDARIAKRLLAGGFVVRTQFLRRFAQIVERGDEPGEGARKAVEDWFRADVAENGTPEGDLAHLFPEAAVDAVLAKPSLGPADFDLLLEVGLSYPATFRRAFPRLVQEPPAPDRQWRLWSVLHPAAPGPVRPEERVEIVDELLRDRPDMLDRILEGLKQAQFGPVAVSKRRGALVEARAATTGEEFRDYWDRVHALMQRHVPAEQRERRLSRLLAGALTPGALTILESFAPERIPGDVLPKLLRLLGDWATARPETEDGSRAGRLRERLEGSSLLQRARVVLRRLHPSPEPPPEFEPLAGMLISATAADRRCVLDGLLAEAPPALGWFLTVAGRLDADGRIYEELAAREAADATERALASWLFGRSDGDPSDARVRAAALRSSRRHPRAVLWWAISVEDPSAAGRIVREEMEAGGVEPDFVAGLLRHRRFTGGLGDETFRALFDAIGETSAETAAWALAARLDATERIAGWEPEIEALLNARSLSDPPAIPLVQAAIQAGASPEDAARWWRGLSARVPPDVRLDAARRQDRMMVVPALLSRHGIAGLHVFFRELAVGEDGARAAADLLPDLPAEHARAILLEIAAQGSAEALRLATSSLLWMGDEEAWRFGADLVARAPLSDFDRRCLAGNLAGGRIGHDRLRALDRLIESLPEGEGRWFLSEEVRSSLERMLHAIDSTRRFQWDTGRIDPEDVRREPRSSESRFVLARLLNENAAVHEILRMGMDVALVEVFEELELKPMVRRMWAPMIQRWRDRRDRAAG